MDGNELAKGIRQKADEFKNAYSGVDEATASRAPEGRWSPKEVVSHLIGSREGGMLLMFKAFVEQDTPTLDLQGGNAHFTADRAGMSLSELLAEFEKRYADLADFIAGLSPEQLERKAHIPALKESPMGEYPSLGVFVGALAEYHLKFHIDHVKEILEALRK